MSVVPSGSNHLHSPRDCTRLSFQAGRCMHGRCQNDMTGAWRVHCSFLWRGCALVAWMIASDFPISSHFFSKLPWWPTKKIKWPMDQNKWHGFVCLVPWATQKIPLGTQTALEWWVKVTGLVGKFGKSCLMYPVGRWYRHRYLYMYVCIYINTYVYIYIYIYIYR